MAVISRTKTGEKLDLSFLGPYIKAMREFHKGQVDKLSQPYWKHPLRIVKHLIADLKKKDAPHREAFIKHLLLTALFHDVLEDCGEEAGQKLYLIMVEKEGETKLPLAIMDSIMLLTKPRQMRYVDYIKAIVDSGDKIACLVKTSDMLDNTSRLDLIQDKATRERLRAKYERGLAVFQKLD